MPFTKIGLSDAVLKGVHEAGYTQPTEIQIKSIPHVRDGKDLIATAQTGTGKTAAFVLPIIDRIHENKWMRCLVLSPTRELAAQIGKSINTYARYTNIRRTVIHGGVPINPQIKAVARDPHIVVATPGRLLDLAQQKKITLSKFNILVLDEADHMLDMGFLPDVRRIVKQLPQKDRQSLLFSATMPTQIESLARQTLRRDAIRIQVGKNTRPAPKISQYLYPVAREQKMTLLKQLLKKTEYASVLIFTRTKHAANKVADKLNKSGFSATQIHGDRSQNQRTRSLEDFRKGKFKILVATEIAARGIDIKDVSHVINFDAPETTEAYVHRVGRTARAERLGSAVTFVARNEEMTMHRIQQHLKTDIERVALPEFN